MTNGTTSYEPRIFDVLLYKGERVTIVELLPETPNAFAGVRFDNGTVIRAGYLVDANNVRLLARGTDSRDRRCRACACRVSDDREVCVACAAPVFPASFPAKWRGKS